MTRPARVWSPGALFIDDDGEVVRGRGAGLLVETEGYPSRALGSVGRLADLRHAMWLVERASLDDAMVREFAFVLPETLLDRDVQPFAYRWLASLPLVCFSGVKWDRVVRHDRLRGYRVAIVERGGRVYFELSAAGGKRAGFDLKVAIDDLEAAARAVDAEAEGDRLARAPSVIDRVLRGLSHGALDEASVLAAFQAASLLEPGYGYRGALDGSPATIEQVQYGARALEAAFASIGPRAESQHELTAALVDALAAADAEAAATVKLPLFGLATRLASSELKLDGRLLEFVWSEGGQPREELVLPEEPRWFVSEVEPWRPVIPAALAKALERVLKEPAPPPEWLVFVAVATLVALAILSFLLRG